MSAYQLSLQVGAEPGGTPRFGDPFNFSNLLGQEFQAPTKKEGDVEMYTIYLFS